MRWFEYSFKCCGEGEAGYIPAADRTQIRCWTCHRYQRPLLNNLHEDDIDYDEYIKELLEDYPDEDEDWEDLHS